MCLRHIFPFLKILQFVFEGKQERWTNVYLIMQNNLLNCFKATPFLLLFLNRLSQDGWKKEKKKFFIIFDLLVIYQIVSQLKTKTRDNRSSIKYTD